MKAIKRRARLFLALLLFLFSDALTQADERPAQLKAVQPGVNISLVAEHPDLATPTGVDVDDDGRIWVVATHTHFRPEDYVGPKYDEVLIFSDEDGDGRAESRTVFYNKTEATMDLELGPDGWVYLAERDRILRIKDTDGDGTADVEEDIAVLSTEADYPHNGLEGLAWHTDGDLIFGIGENFAKAWTLTGTDDSNVSGTGEGGIFRCSADGERLRRIARGFWNPFGICVRDDGEIFASENDPGERPPCRLLHIVPGGDYGYQRNYGPEAHHPFVAWNGELRGTLPMIHPSGEAPCGVLPLRNGLLVPSWSDHRIDFFLLRQKGASYDAERIQLVQGGRYFRPSCIASAAGGEGGRDETRVWHLCDWVDGRYQSHGYGRLWRLEIDLRNAAWVGPERRPSPSDASVLAKELREDTKTLPRDSLMQLAQDGDPFLARSALIALSRSADAWAPTDVASWPAEERRQAVLALKLRRSSPTWVKTFLADEDAEVQFETLRWIADHKLLGLKSDVEDYSRRSDLDYRRFEASIATLNTLEGRPEAGVRHPEMLLARVKDSASPPNLRAFALRLLPQQPKSAPKDGSRPATRFSNGLSLPFLKELLALGDESLSMEVVRVLAGNPVVAQNLLHQIANDPQSSIPLRADAIAGLASVAEGQVDFLISVAESTEKTLREEALRSLRFVELTEPQRNRLKMLASSNTENAELVRAALDPQSLKTQRPPEQDIDAWLAAIDALDDPADLSAGRRLFHHGRVTQCSNCHRHSGRGNVVGPDLSRLGTGETVHDRRWLVESILAPSAEMAPEYQPRTILLKDGQMFTGIRLRSSTREAMRDTNGQNRTFDRDQIESMTESKVSFMPTGAVNALTIREFRDLIAFLESGGESNQLD